VKSSPSRAFGATRRSNSSIRAIRHPRQEQATVCENPGGYCPTAWTMWSCIEAAAHLARKRQWTEPELTRAAQFPRGVSAIAADTRDEPSIGAELKIVYLDR
jgi:hypothetical protein